MAVGTWLNLMTVMERAGLDSRTNPLRILSPLNKGIFRALSSTARGKQGLKAVYHYM